MILTRAIPSERYVVRPRVNHQRARSMRSHQKSVHAAIVSHQCESPIERSSRAILRFEDFVRSDSSKNTHAKNRRLPRDYLKAGLRPETQSQDYAQPGGMLGTKDRATTAFELFMNKKLPWKSGVVHGAYRDGRKPTSGNNLITDAKWRGCWAKLEFRDRARDESPGLYSRPGASDKSTRHAARWFSWIC